MNNRILLIYNPKAGRGVFLEYLPNVIDLFTKAGFIVEVYPTQGPGDATKKMMSLRSNYYMIVAAGGDGTLDQVVTGLVRAGFDIPIGYIPVGSTNDYASSLSLSTNVMESVGSIIAGKPRRVDIGIFNKSHVFIYIAAFGAFTEVAYQTSQDLKNVLGHAAYLIEASKKLMTLRPYRVSVRSEQLNKEDDYIFGMVSNSTSVGGIKNITGNYVKLDDGLFEVTLVRNPRNLWETQEIVNAMMSGNYDTKMVDFFESDHVEFSSVEDIPWTFDGEYGGSWNEVEVHNRARSIRLVLEEGSYSL